MSDPPPDTDQQQRDVQTTPGGGQTHTTADGTQVSNTQGDLP